MTGALVGEAEPVALLVAALVGLLGPQAVAFVVTFPITYVATLQTWFRGFRDARLRFGITGMVYPYYGWRYAFRGRRRPWGAMTREERVLSNPKRAGLTATTSEPQTRANTPSNRGHGPRSQTPAGARSQSPPTVVGSPADVVQQVTWLKQQGLRLTSIAEHLTRDGVPAPNGAATWGAPAVAALLDQHRRL